MRILSIVLALSFFTPTVFADTNKLQAPLFDNLGNTHHEISTHIPLAQRFFDQGLVLFYGFEWSEAIRSFKEATRLDPQCGMCYWGLALALSNKINAPMNENEYSDGKAAIDKALSLSAYESPIEQDYIKALALRYQHSPIIKTSAGTFSCHTNNNRDVSTYDETMAYANAMKKLIIKYPKDHDLKTLYAAALFWNMAGQNVRETNQSIRSATKNLKAVMAEDNNHVGANHYFIHITEPYAHPEQAMASADKFVSLVPGSEHLMHMPTHIYFLTGRYHDGTEASLRAIDTYQQYIKTCRAQGFEPEPNYLYLHNYDFLRTVAAMEGRKTLALSAVEQMIAPPFTTWLANEPSLQWFIPISYYVKARFGMWDEILKEVKPKQEYQYALGMWHYARGMAWAHKGNKTAAQDNAIRLQQIMEKGPVEHSLGEGGYSLLNIANEILMAAIADLYNNEELVIEHLRTANQMQQDMGYHEPPDWYFPVRQALGNAYLKWKHPEKAIIVFKQDLKQYPKNPWSLYGLSKALRMQGKNKEADKIVEEYKQAWKYADIPSPV